MSHYRAGLGPVDTHRMCISMSHQDCKVSQVTAGASGVSLVCGEEFAALCWPVSSHALLRIVPKRAVWIEVVLSLINGETCHFIWMWQLTSARFGDLNLLYPNIVFLDQQSLLINQADWQECSLISFKHVFQGSNFNSILESEGADYLIIQNNTPHDLCCNKIHSRYQ